jgi:hypothetical protein
MDKLDEPFADLRSLEPLEKEQQTLRLMRLGEKSFMAVEFGPTRLSGNQTSWFKKVAAMWRVT